MDIQPSNAAKPAAQPVLDKGEKIDNAAEVLKTEGVSRICCKACKADPARRAMTRTIWGLHPACRRAWTTHPYSMFR